MNNLLTASRQSSLLSCPRKHFWQYEIGLKSETDSLALRFGSAWHRAMEARWNGADFGDALKAGIGETEFEEIDIATLAGLLEAYFENYHAETFIKKVHAEVQFDGPLENSRTFRVAGKIDGLCELHDGRLALKEDKTTSDSLAPDSDYWLRLRFNSQLMQYVLAARAMGWDVATIIYDVVKKPAIQPKQIPLLDADGIKIVHDVNGARVKNPTGKWRESGDKEKGYALQVRIETPEEFRDRLVADCKARPDFYFARREVPVLDGDLEEFAAQRLTLSRMILSCRQMEKRLPRRERAWPRNVSENTCNYCAFQNFCLQNISFEYDRPPVGFKIQHNPELNYDAKSSTDSTVAAV